jgi:hypothetical protein
MNDENSTSTPYNKIILLMSRKRTIATGERRNRVEK